VLSCLPTAGRDIRLNCGALCPFGSLDWGGCGLVVGDDPPWCLRSASIPVGRLPSPAPPPPAALEFPWLILEDVMARRKSALSRPDPAAAALLQTLHPHAAGIDVGATELWVCVPPSAVMALSAPSAPTVVAAPCPPLRRLHRRSARHRRLVAAVPGDAGRDGIDRRVLDPAV
jgi:hypothetical protein